MRKFIGMILSVLFINTAHAGNMSYIHINVAGSSKNLGSYLCVTNAGCLNLAKSSHMKPFPMGTGNIDNIVIADVEKRTMYAQKLPESCSKLAVNDNQTLVVSGQMTNHGTHINNLHCAII